MPRNSELRTVIPNHWYTTAHITEVGEAWERAGRNRLFLSPEVISTTGVMLHRPEIINKTALMQEHVNNVSMYPSSFLLIINRGGNHWTSIAIAILKRQEKININMSFSDSLGDGSLPTSIREEMQRIEKLFHKKYGSQDIVVTQAVYQHAWQQSDIASCGPYALKNGARCLAGKGLELNPGRTVIRQEQLDVMTRSTAIKGCSTNNEIDEILVDWMTHRLKNNLNYVVSSPLGVERICKRHAELYGVSRALVRQKFIDEYGYADSAAGTIHHRAVMTRMQELMHSSEIIRKLATPAQFDAQIKSLRHRNSMKSIELIRIAINKASGDNIFSYGAMAKIIDFLARGHVAEAVEILTKTVTDLNAVEPCLSAIAEMAGSREIEKDYSLKLIGLAKAYRAIYQSASVIKTMESPADAPRWLLKEQMNLLNSAIIRNDASLLMRVAYVLQDFCSALAEMVTLGQWEPEFRKINAIETKLKTSSSSVTRENYQRELESVQCLYDAQIILTRGVSVSSERSMMDVNMGF